MTHVRVLLLVALARLPSLPFEASASEKQTKIDPGRAFDLQAFIDGQIKAGKKRIVIPPGRHRVTPKGRTHLKLVDLKDVEIDADGSELICTETTRAVTIQNCSNLKLSGLTIDYDPLPFSQGRITKLSDDSMVHEIQLFEGYPQDGKITGRKYEIFKPDTRTLRFGSFHGCKVEKLGGGRLRITKPEHYRKKRPERVGDIIAIDCQNARGGSIPHAIYIRESRNISLEGVTVHASNSFGFLESNCRATTYRKCVVDRRAGNVDLKKRPDPRIRSLNADAFHSKHAQVGPSYIKCRARFQGDDCVAINGDYHMVMSASGKELRVLSKRYFNIEPGDPVELVTFDGVRLSDAKATSVKEDGKPSAEEIGFVRKRSMAANRGENPKHYLVKAYRVTLDREVSMPIGSLIASANRMGNGFRVIDCDFGFNRSRGILVKASRGEIRGNRLEENQSPAILLAPEYFWLEAGSSVDVKIEDNEIIRCNSRAIEVSAKGGSRRIAPAGAHADIVIRKNRIRSSAAPQIRVTSTDRLRIEDNTIHSQPDQALDLKQAISLSNCSNETLKGNRIKQ